MFVPLTFFPLPLYVYYHYKWPYSISSWETQVCLARFSIYTSQLNCKLLNQAKSIPLVLLMGVKGFIRKRDYFFTVYFLFVLLRPKELCNIIIRHWNLYAKPGASIGFNKKP